MPAAAIGHFLPLMCANASVTFEGQRLYFWKISTVSETNWFKPAQWRKIKVSSPALFICVVQVMRRADCTKLFLLAPKLALTFDHSMNSTTWFCSRGHGSLHCTTELEFSEHSSQNFRSESGRNLDNCECPVQDGRLRATVNSE